MLHEVAATFPDGYFTSMILLDHMDWMSEAQIQQVTLPLPPTLTPTLTPTLALTPTPTLALTLALTRYPPRPRSAG